MSISPLQSRAGRRPRQDGFSLVAAVFLIVVLAAVGAFAVQVATSQYQGGNLQILEARAQAAADAGIGYAAGVVLAAGTCPSSPLTLTQGTLTGFVDRLTCSQTTHVIGGTSYYAYALTSTASSGIYGRPDYVARTATRNVTNAQP